MYSKYSIYFQSRGLVLTGPVNVHTSVSGSKAGNGSVAGSKTGNGSIAGSKSPGSVAAASVVNSNFPGTPRSQAGSRAPSVVNHQPYGFSNDPNMSGVVFSQPSRAQSRMTSRAPSVLGSIGSPQAASSRPPSVIGVPSMGSPSRCPSRAGSVLGSRTGVQSPSIKVKLIMIKQSMYIFMDHGLLSLLHCYNAFYNLQFHDLFITSWFSVY